MDFASRVRTHRALGNEHRLAIVDALRATDATFSELGSIVKLDGNHLSHHLGVLEASELIVRRTSEGDRRRRYLGLRHDTLASLASSTTTLGGSILFVCTHNSARSQFAAAMWRNRTGEDAESAGSDPAGTVHPTAIRIAQEFGVDLSAAHPKGYEEAGSAPTVVSVCDRAKEGGVPAARTVLHWSTPDPVQRNTDAAFRRAFGELAARIDRLAVR